MREQSYPRLPVSAKFTSFEAAHPIVLPSVAHFYFGCAPWFACYSFTLVVHSVLDSALPLKRKAELRLSTKTKGVVEPLRLPLHWQESPSIKIHTGTA